MEPNSDLRRLLLLYISGEILPDDRSVLYRMVLDDQNEAAGKIILAELSEKAPADPNYRELDWKEMINSIISKKDEVRKITLYKKTWFRAAAAIFIGFLAFSAYLILKPKPEPKTEIAKQEKPDILPGTNKAILTLSNGSTIILDSAHNGLLAKQSGSNVIKSDSGQLTYSKTAEKNAVVVYNTLSTPRGGKFQITLPDGSNVWLNAASSIRYPTAFTEKERRVTITGEAYFEVAHNSKQPFIVSVNNIEVRDIGTHFNINAYTDEKSINTTVLQGSVEITSNKHAQLLKPGQQEQVTNGSGITVENNVDLEKVIAWKNGWFELDKTPLDQLMRQVSRWYDVDIKYDGTPSSLEFGGRISNKLPLSKLLQSLEANGNNLKFTLNDKTIIVGHN